MEITFGIDRLCVADVHVVDHADLISVVSHGDSGQGQGQHVVGVNEALPEPAPKAPAIVVSKLA